MAISVKFAVDATVLKDQCVCLVGDDAKLGAWDPLAAVVMERDFDGQNWKRWSCTVALERGEVYQYRFFVCKQHHWLLNVQDPSTRPLSIDRWETNIRPRRIQTQESGDVMEVPVASFGKFDGQNNVSKGWLVNQCEVQLRLYNNPIFMWKARHRQQSYSIKCVAMDYSHNQGPALDDDEDSRDGPPPARGVDVMVSNLDNEMLLPTLQGPAGMLYNTDDYVVYRTLVPDPQHTGFQLDFFVCEPNRSPKFVGSSHLLPLKTMKSQHKKKVPIIGCNHKPIGEILVEYLVARPVPGLAMDMGTSYQMHWKRRRDGEKSLDIGHRGMGASYSQFSALRENTIASFAAAGQHGADFVEFDVLLSKDKKPVIYHDFFVKVSYSNKKKHSIQSELFELPVSSLTLEQLQSMKLFVSGSTHTVGINDEDSGDEDTEPFPTLEQCLHVVDQQTGFNIEIKVPQQDVNDVWEMENYFDINEMLDIILMVIFTHAGPRKIVFSTFDPDTCILLQMKQNHYPVLFLNQGQTRVYTPYKDYRSSSFRNGIHFALSEQFLGVALHSEVLLRDMELINWVQDKKLVLFVWGQDTNDHEFIRHLRTRRVDGIIYDRIDCHKPEHQPQYTLTSATAAASFKKVADEEDCPTAIDIARVSDSDHSASPAGSGAEEDVGMEMTSNNDQWVALTSVSAS